MSNILKDPIINENPITKQVLGVCSALAVTVLVDKAIVMTIALTLVLTFSNVIISLLRSVIHHRISFIFKLTVIPGNIRNYYGLFTCHSFIYRRRG